MRAAMIIALLLLSGSAFAEEERTLTCDNDTLFTCMVELPCDTYRRNPQGDIVPMGIKIRFSKAIQPGEFNQAEFERAIESKCGKIN
jgi:hypothetical protein